MLLEFVHSPPWFYAMDALIDILSLSVLLFIAFVSFRYWRLDKTDTRYRTVSSVFAVLAFAFLAKLAFDFIFRHEMSEAVDVLVRYEPLPDFEDLIMVALYFLHQLFMLFGLYLLYCVYEPQRTGTKLLVTGLLVVSLFFTAHGHVVFSLLNIMLTMLVAVSYGGLYFRTRNRTTRNLALNFGVIAVSALLFLFAQVFPAVYLGAKSLQLLGFLGLLYTLLTIHKNKPSVKRNPSRNGTKTIPS